MENVDSGWEKKEWSCVDDFWGKGCGWKGSGCDCLPFCLLVDLENFVNIGRNGDLPKGCPNCGHRLFSVGSPLVRSKTETSSFGMYDEDYHHAMEFNYEMSGKGQGSSRTPDSSTLPPPPPPRTLTPEGRRRKAKMDKAFKEMLANWARTSPRTTHLGRTHHCGE